MTVKIAGSFKADDRVMNGLESIAKALIDSPLDRRVIVATVETRRIVKDVEDGGTETPTVRFVQIEPLEGEAADQAKALLDAAYQARTGREDMPQDGLLPGDPATWNPQDRANAEHRPDAWLPVGETT